MVTNMILTNMLISALKDYQEAMDELVIDGYLHWNVVVRSDWKSQIIKIKDDSFYLNNKWQ